jgi:hypothetical protein
MRDIWASSQKDVYVVGHNDQNRGQMYHYNGANWTPVHLAVSDGGMISGPFDLSAIYGFSATNIYAVGEKIYQNSNPPPNFLDSSFIIHYENGRWRELSIPRRNEVLACISGNHPNTLWAGGSQGTIYHFNGESWSTDSLGKDFFITPIACLSPTRVLVICNREN